MNMTFSPPQIWVNYITSKKEQRERVFEFLNHIAEAAEQMVQIWECAIVNGDDEIELPERSVEFLGAKYPSNARQFSNLALYYKDISSVMGRNFHSEMEPLLFHLSSLMDGRNLGRIALLEGLKNKSDLIIFDQRNLALDTTSLQEIIHAMQKEAAALRVKVQVFRIGAPFGTSRGW